MFDAMQPSSVNISSCRVCLKTVGENRTSLDENSNLLKLFAFCTDITILPQEKARTVCGKCADKIKSHARFKKRCLEANEIWKSLEAESVECFAQNYSEAQEVKNELLEVDEQNLNRFDNNCMFEEDCISDIKYELEDQHNQLVTSKIQVNHKHTKVKKEIHKIRRLTKAKLNYVPKTRLKVVVQNSAFNCCGLCSHSSTSNDENRNHLSEHWSNNNFKCNMCSFSSQDSAGLLTHRYIHITNMSVRLYVCHICNKKCASALSLEFHYRSIHLRKPGGFCSQCRKPFTVFNTWKKHNRLHTLERFICDHCGKKFLYRHEIEAHLIDHGETRNFICDACGKSFKRKFALKTHMDAVHSSEAIKCTHCDKIFKSQITYKDHIKVVNAEKPFICVHCGKTYHLESALRSHMFWHSGARPHVCDVCGSKYKSKGQLKVHMRNHTGYMPFKCSHCDKCFTSSQPLKRHQSVHTGKRAHGCTYCERTFHERKALIEHCALSHKVKLNVQLETSLCEGKETCS